MSESTERFVEAARRIAKVAPLTSLRQKVDPAHSALIVIDMQNDFCASGGFVDRGGRDLSAVQEMAKNLPALIEKARQSGVLVVFVKCSYSTDQNFFLSDVWLEQAARKQGGGYTLSPVCKDGSWEADFYEGVRPGSSDVVVTKHRYSGFHQTDLDLILRANSIRSIILTGVTTNVCVETTARDGFVRDYYVVLVEDGTAAYSAEEHQATIKTIDRFFGEIATIGDLTNIWGG
jgi:ureidoacrylate peracid hydrolase